MNARPHRSIQPLDGDIAVMAFLQASSLFGGLPAEHQSALFENGRVLECGPGEAVYTQGATDDALYIIISGSIILRAQAAGASIDLATLERQAVFGETAVLTRQPRTTAAVTRTETRLIQLPGELIRDLADAVPKLGRRLAALMAARS